MWSPEEIKSQFILKKISQAELAEECGVAEPHLSIVLRKTQKILPRLIEILGENPFQVEDFDVQVIGDKAIFVNFTIGFNES